MSRRVFLGDLFDFSAAITLFPIIPLVARKHADNEALKSGIESYLSFYEPLDPLPVKGSNLQLIGVSHTREILVENMEDIRSRVQHAPFVLLESFAERDRTRSLPTVRMDQPMHDLYDNDSATQFFSGIGRICAQERKDIIVVNPETIGELFAFDIALQAFVPTAIAAGAVFSILRSLQGHRMTRRRFLRHIGIGASALVSASWRGITRNLRSALEEDGILTSDIPENEKANILGWSSSDYRDLRSADGIEKAFEIYHDELSSEDRVPMFEGANHSGKLEYLQYPELREAKRLVYTHYDLVDTNTVRRYTYNPDDNVWSLKQEIPY